MTAPGLVLSWPVFSAKVWEVKTQLAAAGKLLVSRTYSQIPS